MPVACLSCGTQNPDGNNFCQNCGRPLTAAAAPPPPPVAAQAPPPPPPPPAYQSPYYQPAQPMVVHRTPVGLIVGVVVALLVLMGGCGVVLAAVATHPKPSPVAHVTAAPTVAPTVAPTAVPTQAPSSSNAIGTKTWSANAPGFKVLKSDDFSASLLTPSQDGTLFIQSGSLNQSTNTADYIATVMASIAKKYPDASVCLKPVAESHGGKDGIISGTCYTYTPTNGKAFRAADVFWVSVSGGNVLYVYEVFTDATTFDQVYNKDCLPVIDSITWKD